MASDYNLGVQSTFHALDQTIAGSPAGPTVPSGGDVPEQRLAAPAKRYERRGRLGEGGMGEVDHVWDVDLMRDLAVKRLRSDLREDPKLTRQFLWEARVTASLDHPNIVPVHDLGVAPDGQLYFTMKRVSGMSLTTAIAKLGTGDREATRELTLPRRLRMFLQTCQAVEFAHARGILHRDLKPDNIMLGGHGEVIVMDWGLALALPGADSPIARAHEAPVSGSTLSGTPMYMAPEQAACADDLDQRADVFSLGAILYELCALRHPYAGRTVEAILAQARSGDIVRLSPTPEVSASLCAVIHKAMAHDRARRYATVAELHADVELILDGRTPSAEGASFATRLGRYAVRSDRRLGALRPVQIDLLMGGAMIVGVGVGSLLPRWFESWAWLAIVVGVAMCLPFMVAWWRTIRK